MGRVIRLSISSGATPSYWVVIDTCGMSASGMRSTASSRAATTPSTTDAEIDHGGADRAARRDAGETHRPAPASAAGAAVVAAPPTSAEPSTWTTRTEAPSRRSVWPMVSTIEPSSSAPRTAVRPWLAPSTSTSTQAALSHVVLGS